MWLLSDYWLSHYEKLQFLIYWKIVLINPMEMINESFLFMAWWVFIVPESRRKSFRYAFILFMIMQEESVSLLRRTQKYFCIWYISTSGCSKSTIGWLGSYLHGECLYDSTLLNYARVHPGYACLLSWPIIIFG